jgi:hypothetical protein
VADGVFIDPHGPSAGPEAMDEAIGQLDPISSTSAMKAWVHSCG